MRLKKPGSSPATLTRWGTTWPRWRTSWHSWLVSLSSERTAGHAVWTMSEGPRVCGVVVGSGKRTQAVEHQHAAHDLAEAFGSFDRARLDRMSEVDRASQLDARQRLHDYVDGLWADIQQAGERPAVGEKYQAIAAMRELTGALRTIAFEAVYNAPD